MAARLCPTGMFGGKSAGTAQPVDFSSVERSLSMASSSLSPQRHTSNQGAAEILESHSSALGSTAKTRGGDYFGSGFARIPAPRAEMSSGDNSPARPSSPNALQRAAELKSMSPIRRAQEAATLNGMRTQWKDPQLTPFQQELQQTVKRPLVATYQIPVPVTHHEIERLQNVVETKDLEIASLKRDLRDTSELLHEKTRDNAQLIHRLQSSQHCLSSASEVIKEQEAEIVRLKKALAGEISDNSALTANYTALLQRTKQGVQTMREETAFTRRADLYGSNSRPVNLWNT